MVSMARRRNGEGKERLGERVRPAIIYPVRRIVMKTLTIVALLLLVPVLLSACNTVEGVGQDISARSRAVLRAAE